MLHSTHKPRILLLTGTPGIGKTTVICKVATAISACRISGFFTEEIRQAGVRQGFGLTTFDGQHVVIAHVDFDHRYRVSKYGVDVAAIDRFADNVLALADQIDVYLVDEIGKMECLSQRFVHRMRALLESDKSMVATVAKYGGGLIRDVKLRPDSELWALSRANRDAVAGDVVEWVNARVRCRP